MYDISVMKLEETYCKNDETCFPLLKSLIDKNYYGIRIRISDVGTVAPSSDTQACIKIPRAKRYELTNVFDKNRQQIELVDLEQTGPDPNIYSTLCYKTGEFERFGEKTFFIILRRSKKESSDEELEEAKGLPDFNLFFLEKPQCSSMFMERKHG